MKSKIFAEALSEVCYRIKPKDSETNVSSEQSENEGWWSRIRPEDKKQS